MPLLLEEVRRVARSNDKSQMTEALPKKSGLAKSAQRTSESSPALQCWEPVGNVPQSVQRTTDKSSTGTALRIQPSVSRTVACDRADPTDESVGYFSVVGFADFLG